MMPCMEMTIDGLPEGLSLDGIRQRHSHLWVSDKTLTSPDGQAFCSAFDIVEMTMMNYVAGAAWGTLDSAGKAHVTGHLPAWSVCCWSPQFCSWITPHTFVVKLSDKALDWPLLAIHIERGFQLVGKTGIESRPADISAGDVSPDAWVKNPPLSGS